MYAKHAEYRVLANKVNDDIRCIYNRIYQELCLILKHIDITIFCCVINKNNYKYLYDGKYIDDFYDICIETIIENYIHFLDDNNAVGSIVYEARNSPNRNDSNSLDVKMFNNFCAIKLQNKGMPNLTLKSTCYRLRNFTFQRKSGENLCLSFADFIVYNVSKMQHIEPENRNEFMKKIYNASYNGNNRIEDKDLRDYFGIRVIPFDIIKFKDLEIQNKIMKKKIKNQKK